MSDEIEIPIDPNATRQQAVDAVVEKITGARGAPDRAAASVPTPALRYNTATDEVTRLEGRTDAPPPMPTPSDPDISDGIDLQASQDRLVNELLRQQAKLEEFYYHPETGERVYKVQGRERYLLELRVKDLHQAAADQKERYERALAARAEKAEQKARLDDAARMGDAAANGDPELREEIRRALIRRKAEHIADAMIRTQLGQLD